jgi:hypothetical protein
MAENNDVFNRADSLITGRRRAFIAAPAMPKLDEVVFVESFVENLAKAPVAEDEDIPVLTDVVPPEAAVSEAAPDRFDETLLSILAADLAHSIETRLGVELPSLIEATLDSFQQDLRRGIVAATEAALKDFLARRQQLRLPLDEPGQHD